MKFLKTFLLFSTCIYYPLFSGVFDHLKAASDKGAEAQMRNIDFIYMINLDQRPEKFARSCKEFAPYGIHPYRFSAVNGWELTLEEINDVGLVFSPEMEHGIGGSIFSGPSLYPEDEIVHQYGKTYFSHRMSRGAIGIVLSHVSVLKDAYDSGYETVWVLEDDIHVLKDPHLLSELIDRLDLEVGREGWDILFTDKDTRDRSGKYVPCCASAKRPDFVDDIPDRFFSILTSSKTFRRIGTRYGAYSMIYSRSGMEKILEFYQEHPVFLPFDMEYYFPRGMRLYTILDDLVMPNISAPTDNGKPNYRDKKREG